MGICASSAASEEDGRFQKIEDNYDDLPSLQRALRAAGLESCNLIVAVDFTASNKWQGARTFGGLNLHTLRPDALNPYEAALSIVARTLSAFDDDGLIPAFGFGDLTTADHSVLAFTRGDKPCNGLDDVLTRYRALVPHITLAGPTSFAPAIRKAMQLVKDSGGQFHVLIVIADGQVTGMEAQPGRRKVLSPQERDTVDAIVAASALPLAIVCIGVGDGPWDTMENFDDDLPQRKFDNFQFVPLASVLERSKARAASRAEVAGGSLDMNAVMEASFAVAALQEIPEAYRAIQRMNLTRQDKVDRVSVARVKTVQPPAASLVGPAVPVPVLPAQGGGMGGAVPFVPNPIVAAGQGRGPGAVAVPLGPQGQGFTSSPPPGPPPPPPMGLGSPISGGTGMTTMSPPLGPHTNEATLLVKGLSPMGPTPVTIGVGLPVGGGGPATAMGVPVVEAVPVATPVVIEMDSDPVGQGRM